MSRVHAFEFNDLEACPRPIRDSVVEILGRGLEEMNFGDILAPEFDAFAQKAGVRRVLDLASGTGVPARLLSESLGDDSPRFVMSDLHTNLDALEWQRAHRASHLDIYPQPLDATQVPASLDHDARTIINAFHHFGPELAQSIISAAVADRKALFIYEGFPRNLLRILPTMPAMGPAVWTNPLHTRRDQRQKALLTYALPVIPMVSLWDAAISVLRVYDRDELMAFAEAAGGDYEWSYREVPYGFGGLGTVFTGIPRAEA